MMTGKYEWYYHKPTESFESFDTSSTWGSEVRDGCARKAVVAI